MKVQVIKCMLLLAVINAGLVGCAARESVITREISAEGPNSIENVVIEERRAPGKRRVIEKDIMSESIQCIGRDGLPIAAKTDKECLKKGGRVIDEIVTQHEKVRR